MAPRSPNDSLQGDDSGELQRAAERDTLTMMQGVEIDQNIHEEIRQSEHLPEMDANVNLCEIHDGARLRQWSCCHK